MSFLNVIPAICFLCLLPILFSSFYWLQKSRINCVDAVSCQNNEQAELSVNSLFWAAKRCELLTLSSTSDMEMAKQFVDDLTGAAVDLKQKVSYTKSVLSTCSTSPGMRTGKTMLSREVEAILEKLDMIDGACDRIISDSALCISNFAHIVGDMDIFAKQLDKVSKRI